MITPDGLLQPDFSGKEAVESKIWEAGLCMSPDLVTSRS